MDRYDYRTSKGSGKSLEYSTKRQQKFIPHSLTAQGSIAPCSTDLRGDSETGAGRKGKWKRGSFAFSSPHPPIKAQSFRIEKQGPLVAKAKRLSIFLRPHSSSFTRERAMAGVSSAGEIGTPFGITVDFETLVEKRSALLTPLRYASVIR